MHITELRIAGFKSFVDPETVPIEPGLTGIVGPNGCGKSNLLEALRWAMGATSAKAMRGGEMDDLIFSGSASRAARENAEVTLVLDNSARMAPPEFNGSDTLEILRRLKRGAGSTYKLNGRTVRGKDIKLIFADASTGANSPSLVRQGQISELIASKPQNRRRILEEAAGIAGLNTRRHEAELKLRAAENNLERLAEVSAEVERQLDSLKRQARKARKYKELSAKIQALDAWMAHAKWASAKADQDEAGLALARAKSEVERLTRAAAVAETERLKASEGLQPLRDAEAIAAGKLGQSRIDLARIEAERKAASDVLAGLERELTRLSEDLAREQTQKEEAAATLEEAKAALAALPVANDEINRDKEAELQAALDTAKATLQSAQDEADQAQENLSSKRAEIQALEANANAHRQRKERLEAEAERLRAALSDLPDTAALAQQLETARKAEADAQAAVTAAQAAIETAEAALETAQTGEADAKAPAEAAQDTLRLLETEITGLTRLLRKDTGPKAPPVIEQMRTRDGYEKAVAAALGDDLQAPTDRSASIHWAGSEAKTESLPGYAKPLTDFVEAPGELAARLSQCGVVSVSEGEQLASDLRPGQRLVTLDGHLWRWDGFTRTPAAPTPAAERLEQQARLEDAQAKIGPARQGLSEAQGKLAEAKGARIGAEDDLKAARRALRDATDMLDKARRDLAAALQASDRASLKADGATEALARVEADLSIATEAYETAARPENTNDLTVLQTQVEAARTKLTKARETETEARGRLTDLTRNRQQAMARREALEGDVTRWQNRLTSAETRLEGLIKRRGEVVGEAANARAKPESLTQQVDALVARVETLEAERQTAADNLAVREAAIRETETTARSSANLAMSARETLAITNAKLENASTRLTEASDFALSQFQRSPEGLLPLAQAGLSEEELETLDLKDAERQSDFLKRDREGLGGVNMEAEAEAEALATRLGTQVEEKADLTGAIAKLREGVKALNSEGRKRLMEAFDTVNDHFKALFTTLFRGGEAELRLVDADDPLNAGLEIFAQPPGKRLGTLSLMSGGEQALTATALIFAVFLSRPSPICVLDEVDAPLDDANVDRFCRMLDEMRGRTKTRFIVITHNAVTMSRMDRLFGVTMREKGVSKLVSVDLHAAEELVAAQ
ncbi:chromosome segregation protein SMC [Hyphomonas sp. FCG-A18]|uniref:chromosome segregation protein SMC n=1 Tax=Hyphomonas sp. FCG-A18 TaxID=3080019 RepID=UPI002B2BEDD4|nr:chromosome segregation protein SMC [Hyphomonas sp. FCG-A18]